MFRFIFLCSHDAQMDYYGTRLATCSSDSSVKNLPCQKWRTDYLCHEGPVWQVAWAQPHVRQHPGLLCSRDRKVIIWKEEEWYLGQNSVNVTVCCNNPMSSLCPVRLAVNAVSWAPTVVPGGLIDQPSGQNPNCTKRFVSGGCDNLVKLWKEEDGQWKEDQKLEAHSDWDSGVFIWTCDDPSGNKWTDKLRSITGNILAVSGGDNKVTLWKESADGQWACISDVNKVQGAVSTITDGAAS
uniref:SEC13 homolog, nuclear pore and COPII coat complex component n=1 Tax=Oncorhynchus kisutch TaxID=8019 RepID=A0A8C7FBS8_ONCKI